MTSAMFTHLLGRLEVYMTSGSLVDDDVSEKLNLKTSFYNKEYLSETSMLICHTLWCYSPLDRVHSVI